MQDKKFLVTITAPTAAGKSHILNYIREVAKIPCIVSTTTRAPRKGEREGVDYYFISEEESVELENQGAFAELAIYNGVRYGVKKEEFESKLNAFGLTFLIVEPNGMEGYVKPAVDAGAIHIKTFVYTDPKVRMKRFKERALADLDEALRSNVDQVDAAVKNVFNTYLNRQNVMLTKELSWGEKAKWDLILMGEEAPEDNLQKIFNLIASIRSQI